MCKYCKLRLIGYISGKDVEFENENVEVGRYVDGSQIFKVSLNRYMVKTDEGEERLNELTLEMTTNSDYGEIPIGGEPKTIQIKYCPFCGEEL